MNTLRHNRYAPAPLFLVAVLFILSGPIFWISVEAPGNDQPFHLAENSVLFQQIYPEMHYGFSRLGRGEFPLWNSHQLCGTPFFANPRHALLQPLNLVFLFFETSRAMALHAFIALSLMGFFFALFLRALKLRHIPAVLGGLIYMCCGATASVMSRPASVNVLVWLPLLCFLILEYLRWPHQLLKIAGGIVTAFLLLSGAPLLTAAALLFAFGYALTALLSVRITGETTEGSKRYGRWKRFRGLVSMAVWGLLLSCVQWAPTLAWLHGLDAPLEFLTHFTVGGEAPASMRELLAQLLEAHSNHLPALAYVGISTLLLLPMAMFHTLSKGERLFLYAAASGLLFVAMAGSWGLSSTNTMLVLVYPASFALSVLAALGADRLFATRRDSRTPRLWGPLVLISLVFLVLFLLVPGTARGRMLPLAAAVLLFFILRTSWSAVLSGMILLVFLFIDLNTSTISHQPHPFFTKGAGAVVDKRLAGLLQESALDDRVLVSVYPNNHHIHANIGMSDGFRMAGATGIPLTPEQKCWWDALEHTDAPEGDFVESEQAPYLTDPSPEHSPVCLLNVMSVRAVAASTNGDLPAQAAQGGRLRRRGGHADISVYANESVLPRVSWAQSWQIALETQAAIKALCAPDFNSRQECIIVPMDTALSRLVQVMPEKPPLPGDVPLNNETPPSPQIVMDKPEHITIKVSNRTPGILVLSDTYDPGWRAYVNNLQAPILRVNGLFRGIALPGGDHVVEFYYRPSSFYLGIAISLLTIAFLLARGLWALVKSLMPMRKAT